MSDAKVTYTRLDGYVSTAYVTVDEDANTGEGEDKYTDEFVLVEWVDDAGWREVRP